MPDRVLVVGSGGREHALCWKLAASPAVEKILWAPANGAAALNDHLQACPVPADDITALADLAHEQKIDLTVVGPEAPLAEGIVQAFKQRGLPIFGPDTLASRLEASKTFTKELCVAANIPTAAFSVTESLDEAKAIISRHNEPLVIKADGLAAGKGVFICQTRQEALRAAEQLLTQQSLGAAGKKILIEQHLTGIEASFMALADGENYALLPTSKDHKRLQEGDRGPNTGGMGAYSPSADLSEALSLKVEQQILQPLLREIAGRGCPYRGAIYLGLMLKNDQPQLLEVNVRLGDPEAQVLLPRIDEDLYPHLLAIARGDWKPRPLKLKKQHALVVVLASAGYPAKPQKGQIISGLETARDSSECIVFHAGTRAQDSQILVNGGRVLGVTALGNTLAKARQIAYSRVESISFEGKTFRRDIGPQEKE